MDSSIIRYLEEKYSPSSILVYGSYADGTEDRYSDFDCMLIVDEKTADVDNAVIGGVSLDCRIFTVFDTYSEDLEPFLPVYDAVILKDRMGTARALKERVRGYVEANRVCPESEKRQILLWSVKLLRRMGKKDEEGNYRAIELLSQSLSDYFRLRDMFFPGSRKAIRWLQENDGEGFELYRKALLMRTNSSIEDWIRHSVAPVVQTLFKHLSET